MRSSECCPTPSLFESIHEDVQSFYANNSQIKRLHNPDCLEFLQTAVLPHQPCIITGLVSNWKVSYMLYE